MQACKALIEQGVNKGITCERPVIANEYCGRHQRNHEYDLLIKENKIACNNFFRKCDNTVPKNGKCIDCKNKNKKGKKCEHKDCSNGTTDTKYCGKHERDLYRDEEKEKKIKYCNINRGCFNIITEGSSCSDCRDKENKQEAERRKERNKIHTGIEANKESKTQLCVNCGKDFEKFNTRYHRVSKICLDCKKNNTKQDEKRAGRVRNYRKEKFNNIENFFKIYVSKSQPRGYSFNLQYEDFKKLVLSSCYYCGYKKDDEVNGIDRVDNSKGYELENCVTCCKTCNRMKNYLHPLFFINLCKIYASGIKPNKEFYKKTWKEYYGRSCYHVFSSYKKHSEEVRGIPVNINQSDWDQLTRSPCYLCGFQDSKGVGIDRVDNTIREYSLPNIKPCCGTCNNVKGCFSLEIIKTKAQLIAEKWKDTAVFDTVPRGVNPMKNDKVAFDKERIEWKPLGIYYDILSDENKFYEQYSNIITDQDYENLIDIVAECEKEEALLYIKELYDNIANSNLNVIS